MPKLAIIDDGIAEEFASGIREFYEVQGQEVKKTVPLQDKLTHGSICSDILKNYTTHRNIISIKILNEMDRANIEDLVTALQWCVENDVKIISLSLGSGDFKDKELLQPVIDKLTAKNIIIVAACNNYNSITYPASMQGVIGVKCDISGYLKAEESVYADDSIRGIELTVGSLKDVEEFNAYNLSYNNSYVVPYITAITCNLAVSGKLTVKEILEEFKCTSVPIEDNYNFYAKSFPMLFKPAPIMLMINGKDSDHKKLSLITEQFRENDYNAILISSDIDREGGYCYSYKQIPSYEGTDISRGVDLIIKASNPDIVVLPEIEELQSLSIDCCISIDDSTDISFAELKSKFSRQGTEKTGTDEVSGDNEMQFIGSVGDYGISVMGPVDDFTVENTTFVGDIDDKDKQNIVDTINMNLSAMMTSKKSGDEDEESMVSVTVHSDFISTGELIELIEEIFS